MPWKVGVAQPFVPDAVALVLQGDDLAVATSGTTERGHHIADPHSGQAADELLTLTVAGPDLGRADAYATAAFAMGREGLRWVEALPGYYAAGITHDARLITTRGLDRLRV